MSALYYVTGTLCIPDSHFSNILEMVDSIRKIELKRKKSGSVVINLAPCSRLE